MLGCDPEGFLIKEGKIIPAETVLGEKEPFKGRYSVYHDGVPFEFGISPVSCRDAGGRSVSMAMSHINKMGYEVLFQSAVDVNEIDLSNATDKSFRSGCSPSYDAYTLDLGSPPIDFRNHPYMYAGCHLHYGIQPSQREFFDSVVKQAEFARLCDILVGIPCELLHPAPTNAERRKYFGRPGEFRCKNQPEDEVIKDATFEYRSLGAEMMLSPMFLTAAWGLFRYAYTMFTQNLHEPFMEIRNKEEIYEILSKCDKYRANEMFEDVVKVYASSTDYYTRWSDPIMDSECGVYWNGNTGDVSPLSIFRYIANETLHNRSIVSTHREEWLDDYGTYGFISGSLAKGLQC